MTAIFSVLDPSRGRAIPALIELMQRSLQDLCYVIDIGPRCPPLSADELHILHRFLHGFGLSWIVRDMDKRFASHRNVISLVRGNFLGRECFVIEL